MEHSGGRNKDFRPNRMENLQDIFLCICKSLKSDYVRSRNRYRLSLPSLTVSLEWTIDKMDITEVIHINKKWGLSVEESVVYTSDFIEPHIYEAHQKVRIMTTPGEDWVYRHHLTLENKNRYLSLEMYVDNLTIQKPPDCTLSYATSRLSQGLRTLAKLKFPQEQPPYDSLSNPLLKLYEEVDKTAESSLAIQLGQDKASGGVPYARARQTSAYPSRRNSGMPCRPGSSDGMWSTSAKSMQKKELSRMFSILWFILHNIARRRLSSLDERKNYGNSRAEGERYATHRRSGQRLACEPDQER